MSANMPDLIFPELSYSIIGAAMHVHNELGPGWNEWDYHRAMIEAICARGHGVVSHYRKNLEHKGKVVDHFELDLLVDNLVILELKQIKTRFHSEHYTQIINYLKRWEKNLGILINFGMERLSYKRVPYDPVIARCQTSGKWAEVAGRIPEICERIEKGINGVLAAHGYGYSTAVFQKLLIAELGFLGATAIQPMLMPVYGGLKFERREIDCVSVDSELLVSVCATGKNASATDLAYLKSYMKQTQICNGILIDIGSADIQIKGVL
jgi:GxxExxY protein